MILFLATRAGVPRSRRYRVNMTKPPGKQKRKNVWKSLSENRFRTHKRQKSVVSRNPRKILRRRHPNNRAFVTVRGASRQQQRTHPLWPTQWRMDAVNDRNRQRCYRFVSNWQAARCMRAKGKKCEKKRIDKFASEISMFRYRESLAIQSTVENDLYATVSKLGT